MPRPADHAKADPAAVVGQIVDAVGHDLAKLFVLEVMDLGSPRLAFGAVLGALVGVVADQLLLLGVDRDHRLIVSLEGQNLGVDVLELSVTVGMLASIIGLAIGQT